MKAQGGGRIVYVSSVSGRVILPFHEAYTSTKVCLDLGLWVLGWG